MTDKEEQEGSYAGEGMADQTFADYIGGLSGKPTEEATKTGVSRLEIKNVVMKCILDNLTSNSPLCKAEAIADELLEQFTIQRKPK